MGAGEVGEVDEHERIKSSVREHGLKGDVVGRKHRQSVLEESSELWVSRSLSFNDR